MGDYKIFCSYFIEEKALFGGFPSQEQADILLGMNVKYFVDLTFPTEVPTKYTISDDCRYINYPIPDRSVPNNVTDFTSVLLRVSDVLNSLSENEKLYVHCKGGHGRSGILVACLIYLYFQNKSTRECLTLTNEAHNKRTIMRDKWRRIGSPQTVQQKKYVHKLFSDLVFFRSFKNGSTSGFSNYSYHTVNSPGSDLLPAGIFPSSEALFQASKNISDKVYVSRQKQAKNPRVSKTIGCRVPTTDKWNDSKLEIMKEIITLKTDQHPEILNKLTRTGLRTIIYNNRLDDYFGLGTHGDGQNEYGKILMEIRDKRYRELSPEFLRCI